ncbi:MAG: DUF2194 domain-containing protein, partial [Candidatus Humimicrobiaceae bacterium]
KNANELEELPDPVPADIPSSASFENYLIIYDKGEENSKNNLEQIEKVLYYIKKDYITRDISELSVTDLEIYDGIIFTFERLDFLDDLDSYLDYVENGGSLLFMVRPVIDESFREISRVLGIKEYTDINDAVTGIKTIDPLLIGVNGIEYDIDSIMNSSIDLTLEAGSNIRLYLTSTGNIPLLWQKEYGSGRFIIFNGTILNDKDSRGLLCAVLSLTKDSFVYPIANIKMLHIDDFPAPVPQGTNAAIMDEFNRTIPQFYRDIWWSDMIKLAKKYNLKYSGFVVQNYGNDTEPPFPGSGKLDEENLLIYTKEIFNLGGEIGLHGYNHQSLAPEGYIKQDLGYATWENQEYMEKSIREILSFVNGFFPQYKLRAYVPPSNILSEMGRDAIITANKELEIIAGVYLDNIEGDVYSQEFEIAEDGIIEFPRISSGYLYDQGHMWSIYNSLNLYGIFSYFIHPDDILDSGRSGGKSWSVLLKEFESILSEVNDGFNWLNSYTISEGARELRKYLECKPYIEYSTDRINIYCDYFRPDIYFILKTQQNIISSENIEYELIGDGSYLLVLKEPKGTLELGGE